MVYRKLFSVPAWRVRSPFEELERMRNRMDRLIDGFSRGSFETSSASEREGGRVFFQNRPNAGRHKPRDSGCQSKRWCPEVTAAQSR